VRLLGGGKYGEVWLAEIIEGELRLEVDGHYETVKGVALKLMNPGLTEVEKRQFWLETEVLPTLQRYEKQHNLRVDGYSLVPTLFEYLTEEEAAPCPAFFVQTLATGSPLDELMRERGALSEPDALTIIAQFCRVLEALHWGERRSYLDFQPRNIFWNEEARRILVIDWNLLSTWSAAKFREDVLTASRLLYRLLMGVQAPRAGSRRVLAQPPEQWAALSLGAQQILAKALGPNLQERYQEAAAMRKELEDLLKLWERTAEELVNMVEILLPQGVRERIPTSEERPRVEKAALLLSIAERKHPLPNEIKSRIADLKALLEPWLTGRGRLEIGRGQFESLGYQEAVREFQAAIEEAWDPWIALEAARWKQVAQAALDFTAKYRQLDQEVAERGLALLRQRKYEEVINVFEPLTLQAGGDALRPLVNEAHIWILLREVDEAEAVLQLREAARKCGEAAYLSQSLPYAGLMREVLGDLPKRAEELEKRAEAFEAVRKLLDEIEAAFRWSFEEGITTLRKHLDEQPGHPVLVKVARKHSERMLGEMRYVEARAIAALGSDYGLKAAAEEGLLRLWRLSNHLAMAQREYEERDQERLEASIRQASRLEEEPQYVPVFLEACFEEKELAGDYPWAKITYNLMDETTKSKLEERFHRLEEGYRQELERVRKKVEGVRRSVAKVQKLPIDSPGWREKADRALDILQGAIQEVEVWVKRTQEVAWSKEKEELARLQRELKDKKEVLERALEKYRDYKVQEVESLWTLAHSLTLSERERHRHLKRVVKLYSELLAMVPDAPEAGVWLERRKEAIEELSLARLAKRRVIFHPAVRRYAGVTVACLALAGFIFLSGIWCGVAHPNIPQRIASWFRPTPTETPTPMWTPSPTLMPLTPIGPVPPASPSPMPSPTTTIPAPTPTRTPPTPTFTPTPSLTQTPSPSPSPIPIAFAFPILGAEYAVFPWQVVVTGTVPASVTVQLEPISELTVTVTLGDREVSLTYGQPITLAKGDMVQEGENYIYRWQRTVYDLKELPDGGYRLLALLDKTGDGKIDERLPLTLTIRSDLAISASFTVDRNVFLSPTLEAKTEDFFAKGTQVLLLGRLVYVTPEGEIVKGGPYNEERWCLFRDERNKQWWSWCGDFKPGEGKKVEDIPLIAPPQVVP
jgi:hypothetical protein